MLGYEKFSFKRFTALGVISATLVFGLVSCATEPGDASGRTNPDTDTVNPETEWGGLDVPEQQLVTELPETFPSDYFELPADAVIYNTGERSLNQWFVVLRAPDSESANTIWESIVAQNEFQVSDQVETVEGGVSANLENVTLEVQALTIPQEDGSVLLSYDLTMWVDG